VPSSVADFEALHRENTERLANVKHKLDDPEFHQSLTQAHVFHSGKKNENNIDVTGITEAPAIVTYIQDSNPFNFQIPDESSNLDLSRVEIDPPASSEVIESPAATHVEPLETFAPPSRPAHPASRTSKPDVEIVFNRNQYRPVYSTTRATTTTASPPDTIEEDASPDGYAEHVSSFLKEYFSKPENQKGNGTPSLYLGEDNRIIMEYVSPDGERKVATEDRINEVLEDIQNDNFNLIPQEKAVEEDLEIDVPAAQEPSKTYAPNPPTQSAYPLIESLIASEELILPHELNKDAKDALETRLSQLFVPSSSPDDSEWFILDSKGRRVMKHRHKELEETPKKEDTITDEETSSEAASPSNEDIPVVEGFFPSHGPA
jgi:hypothetical protein